MTLKAIETQYNGYRFRSRLEARWAVFFDKAGIKYQYEPEGFEVEGYDGEVYRYLPDFYLPEIGIYAEVKPSADMLLNDADKIAFMIDWEGPLSDGLLILGQIPNVSLEGMPKMDGVLARVPMFPLLSWGKGIKLDYATFAKDKVVRMENTYGYTWPDYWAEAPDLPADIKSCKDLYYVKPRLRRTIDGIAYNLDLYEIPYTAYTAARQARFEHGEAPRG